jgi:urease alpha subunit
MDRKYIFVLLIAFGILIVSGAQFINNHEQVDVLIVNGTIVSMDPDRTILEHSAISIKNGKILAIEKMGSSGSVPMQL